MSLSTSQSSYLPYLGLRAPTASCSSAFHIIHTPSELLRQEEGSYSVGESQLLAHRRNCIYFCRMAKGIVGMYLSPPIPLHQSKFSLGGAAWSDQQISQRGGNGGICVQVGAPSACASHAAPLSEGTGPCPAHLWAPSCGGGSLDLANGRHWQEFGRREERKAKVFLPQALLTLISHL